MATYIHQLSDWPGFRWDNGRLAAVLAAARHLQGRVVGQMEALGFKVREEAVLSTLVEDVLKSSEIEGENLDADQVRSSVARRLGLDIGGLRAPDRHVEGVVGMMLDATQHYEQPLTTERLFGWHASLFPTGRSGMHPIVVGAWREDRTAPMQVVSGPVGRERVHFEAPAADRLEEEMRRFLEWFNGGVATEPVLKAALAHLWFVTIHPFDDGNGRMARAIADMSLARSEGSSQRFYSMSAQIREERGEYYRILEQTQRGTMDVTGWMEWFLGCLARAIEGARTALSAVIDKARYWEKLRDVSLNERQRLVVNKLLDGFDGKLTTSKWAALTKSSTDTALRDVQLLVECGVLARNPGAGRSTSYSLASMPMSPERSRVGLAADSVRSGVRHEIVPIDAGLRFAISNRRLVEVRYGGTTRVAEPHDYGVQNGRDRLLVFQQGAPARPGHTPTGWRLLELSKIEACTVLEETFQGNRGQKYRNHYAWEVIYARVS